MILFLRYGLVALMLTVALGTVPLAHAEAEAFRLVGRSAANDYSVALDEPDWHWLRQKRSVVLGTSAPDYSPFAITGNSGDYEGLTADYAQLIAQLLHVDVQVRRYDSRAQLITALKSGEVDLLGTANGYEANDPQLALTSSYADDQPVLVTRIGEGQSLPIDLAGKRVAMLYHYLPQTVVEQFYPKASVQLYPSTLSALGAVAFGQADVYLGDSISSNYLIKKNYLNNVQLSDFSRMEVQAFAFAVNRDNTQLLRVLNSALEAIPTSERMTILRRWGVGGASMPGRPTLHFSIREQRWMNEHPRVSVAINENYLPLTFIDSDGKVRGVSADVLTKISQRTGLKFDFQRADSVHDLIGLVTSGKADMLAAFTPSIERENTLRFTRPYLTNPFVLITASGADYQTLDQMAGKRLALVRGNVLQEYLAEQFPQVQMVPARNAVDAMAMLARGEVDGAVNSLISARYMISRQYRNRLQVTSTVGTVPARIALATSRGSLELYSILDKALLSIPPEEMDELTNRWRNEVVIDDSYWLRNRSAILQGFGIAGVLLLLALGWIGYLRRLIGKRRQAELALSDQLEFMRVLINGTPHPIYVRDREGKLVTCNAGYLQAFGVQMQTVLGKLATEGVLSDVVQARAYHEAYLQVMDSGEPSIQDRKLTMASGQTLTIYHWMLPYRGNDGRVNGMIAGWIDISERQQLVQALQLAKDDADDANRAKSTFLATMSHEIRTPMNAVIGMLELVMKKADKGVLDRPSIEVASGAARGLLDLIGDILDIARIESGRLSLAPERANVRELIESVARIFDGLARQKNLALILDMQALNNVDVLIDPLRFKQVLSNLLSNAIKFTDAGQVRLSAQADYSPEQQRLQLCVRVEDSGRGISPHDQHRLFSPFTQAENHGQSPRGGSGLGLVISRTLCEMMDGTLTLHSALGQGTQVAVQLDLPVLEPQAFDPQGQGELEATGETLNILVVDDYPANRMLLTQQLSYLGHHVTDAEDGAHGLRAWRNETFDVVITDCNMPIMNGYELARAIRNEEDARGLPRCFVLGFTANALAEEKLRCADAGMDDCVFKPISLKDLSARLAVAAAHTSSPVTEVMSLPPLAMLIDLSALEQLAGGDPASTRRLLGDLAASNASDMARLLQLFTQHDMQGLADLAHRVKGGARIINCTALIDACEALEIATEGLDSTVLIAAVDTLQQSMEQLAAQLDVYVA
ncbi:MULTISPECIES: transporter substrate-binding domain-containing protein [Pseudomonas]|jgi:two-component system sensor histidine kinase EvgS|uniref:histidine kinase n=3 Tax=Pseudomonas TaxID=286 RepID=A0A120G5E8_PSEFL|nr:MULTISPECIES: transporter substrate-binding domain-containing protein [Pseudomonas]KRC97605.1 histidine kinase [Pseudomonas sp. Root9]KWV83998.1 Virulence sensor protein BvgS precursor [Pseudomonas fluorescens]